MIKNVLLIIFISFFIKNIYSQIDANRPVNTIRYQNIHFVVDQVAAEAGEDVVEEKHFKSLMYFQQGMEVDTRVKSLHIIFRADNQYVTDISGVDDQSDIEQFTPWVLDSENGCDVRDVQVFATGTTGTSGTYPLAGNAWVGLTNGYAISCLYNSPREDTTLAHEWAHSIGALSGDHRQAVYIVHNLIAFNGSYHVLYYNWWYSTSIGWRSLNNCEPYFSVPLAYNTFASVNGGDNYLNLIYLESHGHFDIPVDKMDNSINTTLRLNSNMSKNLDSNYQWCGVKTHKNQSSTLTYDNTTSGIVVHYQNHMDYLRNESVPPLATPQIEEYHGKINVSNLQDFNNQYPMTTNANYQSLYYMPGDYQVYVYEASNTSNDSYIAGPYPLGQIIKDLPSGDYVVRVYETWSNNLSPASSTISITDISDYEKEGIKIYPNPTSGLFSIQLEKPNEVQSISISDINGKKVYSKQSEIEADNQINLTNYSKGIYLIQINTVDNLFVIKIMKK